MTDHPRGTGGEPGGGQRRGRSLGRRGGPRSPVLYPAAKASAFFDARRFPHYVRAMAELGLRVAVAMNFYTDECPGGDLPGGPQRLPVRVGPGPVGLCPGPGGRERPSVRGSVTVERRARVDVELLRQLGVPGPARSSAASWNASSSPSEGTDRRRTWSAATGWAAPSACCRCTAGSSWPANVDPTALFGLPDDGSAPSCASPGPWPCRPATSRSVHRWARRMPSG